MFLVWKGPCSKFCRVGAGSFLVNRGSGGNNGVHRRWFLDVTLHVADAPLCMYNAFCHRKGRCVPLGLLQRTMFTRASTNFFKNFLPLRFRFHCVAAVALLSKNFSCGREGEKLGGHPPLSPLSTPTSISSVKSETYSEATGDAKLNI